MQVNPKDYSIALSSRKRYSHDRIGKSLKGLERCNEM